MTYKRKKMIEDKLGMDEMQDSFDRTLEAYNTNKKRMKEERKKANDRLKKQLKLDSK